MCKGKKNIEGRGRVAESKVGKQFRVRRGGKTERGV